MAKVTRPEGLKGAELTSAIVGVGKGRGVVSKVAIPFLPRRLTLTSTRFEYEIRTSSGFSPSFFLKNQSVAMPASTNRQNAALSPFSCVLPQLLPSLSQSRLQTSIQDEMLARRAIDCTVPNAPTEDMASRTKVCWVRAIGSRHMTRPMGVNTAMRMRRVRREGCRMIEKARAKVELQEMHTST